MIFGNNQTQKKINQSQGLIPASTCDRSYFMLDEESFNAFEAALDVPLSDNKSVARK